MRNVAKRVVRRLLAPSYAPSKEEVCFIVASPRSGTTWLHRALNAHPDICCTENRLFGDYFDVIYEGQRKRPRLRLTLDCYVDNFLKHYGLQNSSADGAVIRDRILTAYIEVLLQTTRELSNKPVLVDKVTPYVDTSNVVVKSLQKILPDAKVVMLTRDGRDVLTSGVFHWLKKSRSQHDETEEGTQLAARYRRFVEKDTTVPVKRLFTDSEVNHWARIWVQPYKEIKEGYREDDILHITYEKMNQNQTKVLGELCRFIGANDSDAVLDKCKEESTFKKMSGGREKGEADPTAHVRKGIVGDWKNYFTRRDGEIFTSLAGPELIELGYETRENWVDSLPETLPESAALQ